ncbi:FKBP-type peptidyl-prolyl cis-trans isomerase SlpA [Tepidimonas ignava]|uniref:Peptidyl-prolyl cis-trans isomerase n=1 Tax=Tepidimonas ignava TaxID=114249 RepID=A0A4R3L9D1_9BURK|nr:FKBP-type peptidyl-prolyl cis-trans isomerase [Tepidimonas ignava]TCS96232.1 FKBP-type peptidyl-prolyl cis-trans isomerase SlpA [Tepidimonas ignava]TSE23577.1 isomerase [Tepidimonas ignava]
MNQAVHTSEPDTAPARVAPDSFVTLHYRLAGADGTVLIDTFAAQPATLSLGSGELAPALEQCLLGLAEGDEATFELPPGQAFGARDPAKVQWVAQRLLQQLGAPPEGFAVGDVVQFPTPDGQGSYAGTVRAVRDDGALCVDFNHPLADQAVRLTVRIIGVL